MAVPLKPTWDHEEDSQEWLSYQNLRITAEAKTRGTNWLVGRIIWQGVDHVLRPMREPAHPWGAILHEVREGDPAGWRGDIFSHDGASGRFYRSLRGVYGTLRGIHGNLWG